MKSCLFILLYFTALATTQAPAEFLDSNFLANISIFPTEPPLSVTVAPFFSNGMLQWFIYQFPVYIGKFFVGLFTAAYDTTLRLPEPSDSDVLAFLFHTTLILYVQKSPLLSNHSYVLNLTFDPEGSDRDDPAAGLTSLQVTFHLTPGLISERDGRITEFFVDGAPIPTAPARMGALTQFLLGWAHTKVHAVSGPLIAKIERDGLTELAASTKTTRELHWILLNSITSPLAPWMPYNFPMTRERILNSVKDFQGFHHTGLGLFREFPLPKFLFGARASCFKHLGNVLGPTYTEYFFVHTVVHSVEHHNLRKFTRFKYPLNPTPSKGWGWWSKYNEDLFQIIFSPILNPFGGAELFRDFGPETVYGKIYADMVELDKELADIVTASIVF